MQSSIKKYWLYSSCVYFTSLIITNITNINILGLNSSTIYPLLYPFLELLNFFALYSLSYKRQEVVLLTLNMLLALLRMFVITFPFWIGGGLVNYTNMLSDVDLRKSILTLLFAFLIIFQWVIFSFKLMKENGGIKKKEVLSNPEYQKTIQELQAVSNLSDLTIKYGKSVQTYPQIAGALKKIYKKRQAELSNS